MGELRSYIHSSETRLMAVEAAFLNVQDKLVPLQPAEATSYHDNLVQYFKRLDELSLQIRQLQQERYSLWFSQPPKKGTRTNVEQKIGRPVQSNVLEPL